MLADPKEARAGIKEVYFFPFNPGDKRTALTYIESDGNWHRSSKGAPEQILNLCNCKEDVRRKAMQLLLSLLTVGSDLWGLLDRKYLRNSSTCRQIEILRIRLPVMVAAMVGVEGGFPPVPSGLPDLLPLLRLTRSRHMLRF
ncbi:uncharacterized protein LOC107636080 [Arachis ipaensis]|uniref:uncharacterized protein LOC107636080 n=1 Tax=Arachis ipaensis TaxID=130454 RepID=UPI0007AF3F24|nr:uncharacterized protein LOC107636080 [Arachis ipaensis]